MGTSKVQQFSIIIPVRHPQCLGKETVPAESGAKTRGLRATATLDWLKHLGEVVVGAMLWPYSEKADILCVSSPQRSRQAGGKS